MNVFNQNLLNVMICSVTTADLPAGTPESHKLRDELVFACMDSGLFKAASPCEGRYDDADEDSVIAVAQPGHERLAEKFMTAMAAKYQQECYLLRDQLGVHLVSSSGEWTQRIGDNLNAVMSDQHCGELPKNFTLHGGYLWTVS